MGSFIGGYVAKNLIEKYNIKTPKESQDKSIPLSDFHEDDLAILCHKRLMNGSAFLFIAMGIGSVSYTHLDVYKRQLLFRIKQQVQYQKLLKLRKLHVHFLRIKQV